MTTKSNYPTDATAGRDARPGHQRSLSRLSPLLLEVIAPIGAYYLLHAAGASDVVALSAGAVIPGLSVLATLLRRRRLDQLGLFVCIMFVLGAALILINRDARFILAKQAAFVLVAGITCLISLRGRPVVLAIAKPMATHGERQLESLWERSWVDSAPFRRAVRASTLAFAVALIVDAVGRTVIVYTIPLSEAVVIANVPGLVAIVLALRYHLRHTKPAFQRIKDSAA